MLNALVRQIVNTNPEYAAIAPVIEKEILHHDIMAVMVKEGAMQSLTFIGGTSLRLCYNSSRLSEDLDFNGGHDFKPSQFDGLEVAIQQYIQKKYETEIRVHRPAEDRQGDTSSWKISIVKLMQDDTVRRDFNDEISRFVPLEIRERTVDNPDYWPYVQFEVDAVSAPLLKGSKSRSPFDMGS